jgi:opacity protein-like surface antigen
VSTFHSYANGYTVGTGAEWAFSPTVSLALEYDYYHLNAGAGATTAASGTGVNAFLNTVGPLSANVQTVMLRMNLRFPQLLSF